MTIDFASLSVDFATARKVVALLEDEGLHAVAEEYEIGMAHIRIDPEEEDGTGYLVLVSNADEDDPDHGWVMIPTAFDQDMHTYEACDDAALEALGVAADAEPDEVADAIINFLS